MRAPGWTYPPAAWEPIDGVDGSRALRADAEMVPVLEREKTRKRKKATRTSADANFSAADADARERKKRETASIATVEWYGEGAA